MIKVQKNYWKKLVKAVGACVLLSAVFTGKAEESKNFLVMTDKIADRDLSFGVTFDKFSTSADLALGDPSSTSFKDNLEFRMHPGFDGKNAFNRKGIEELLRYKTENNIDSRQGTITFWAMAKNYQPKSAKSSDQKPCHKPYLYINFNDGKNWVHFYFYQYYVEPVAYFFWQTSACPPVVYKLAGAGLRDIDKNQWFQISATWDEKEIRIYLNGELAGITALPKEGLLPANFKPSDKTSWIGVRESLWGAGGSDPGKETVMDDIKIYSRPLSASEIRNQYLRVAPAVKNATKQELVYIDIELNGVDDGKGIPGQLEATVDFSPLDSSWQNEIKSGKAKVEYTLVSPSGEKTYGIWDSKKLKDIRILDNVTVPGEYAMTMKVTSSGGKTMTATKKILRPDTSWYGNKIGLEDIVPKPWTPMFVDKNNVIKIWNREYCFGDYPLPQQIINGGESLLEKAPEIIVKTTQGTADIKWSVTERKIENTAITLSGTGKTDTFSLKWSTRVEFDGFIKCDFEIYGNPEVKSMKLVWTVKKKFSQFVMNPLLKISGNGKYESSFPVDPRLSATTLWLTSERKGLCWTVENDANWVYAPNEPIINAYVSDSGGYCEIDMITSPVRIPDGAKYHALFIATPSRPLPEKPRTFRLGGYGRYSNCDVALVQHVGEGFESVFTLRLSSYFDSIMDRLKKQNMEKLIPYHAATTCNTYDPVGNYFAKYWDITGSAGTGSYPIRPTGIKTPNEQSCKVINTDPKTGYSDYILSNMQKVFTHPKQRYVGMYYDLADNQISANELNGARFVDKFGRNINSLIIMGMRKHLMRTMKLCHDTGRITIYHGHSYYNPAMHGFADYWYPGEQYSSKMQETKTPYYYSDIISDDEYRSELNMHLKGSGILFLGQLGRTNIDWGKSTEYTEAMCTKLLLNDIPISIAYEDGNVINKIWGVGMKYALDDAEVNFYYLTSCASFLSE